MKALGGYLALVGVLVAPSLAGCGGGQSAATGTTGASTTPPHSPASSTSSDKETLLGGPAPTKLQGTWRLVSQAPAARLLLIISDRRYRIPSRLVNADLGVRGNEIRFSAALCGFTFPEGVGRYRWTVKGRLLHFDLIGKEPCGARGGLLDDATYKRIR